MTTDVAITFDIEFDINGAFANPTDRKPRGRDSLICRKDGRDRGIGEVLDRLNHWGLRATFFVEALQTSYFGDDEMGDIAALIASHGHDVQLHLHPVWLLFDDANWQTRLRDVGPTARVNDSLVCLSAERAAEIIERGKAVFARWGLPPPTAVRTGNLIVERGLYKTFRDCGLMVSSSVGAALYQPDDTAMDRAVVPHVFDGVLEIPVTSYWGSDPFLRRQRRLATVIGIGRREQDALLASAITQEIPCLVILSHVSEFCSVDDDGAVQVNSQTVQKFDRLCRAIATSQDLSSATITMLANKFQYDTDQDDIQLGVPRFVSAGRFMERLIG